MINSNKIILSDKIGEEKDNDILKQIFGRLHIITKSDIEFIMKIRKEFYKNKGETEEEIISVGKKQINLYY